MTKPTRAGTLALESLLVQRLAHELVPSLPRGLWCLRSRVMDSLASRGLVTAIDPGAKKPEWVMTDAGLELMDQRARDRARNLAREIINDTARPHAQWGLEEEDDRGH